VKILHYGLGYPPARTGGLIQYTLDLIDEQLKQGHDISYLYPGSINLINKSPKIKLDKKHSKGNLLSFELVNSLPLPLLGAIETPEDFMTSMDAKIYERFLSQVNPDVIHVHSVMGIHKEFFEVTNKLNIKIVFTSHDYFGLSPNPNFFLNGKSFDEENTIDYWYNAARQSVPTWKLRVFQFPFYSEFRSVMKKLKPSATVMGDEELLFEKCPEELTDRFKVLREYYQDIFSLVNEFHFNSTVAQEVFQNNLSFRPKGKVLPISNASIKDKKGCLEINTEAIKKIGYIGSYKSYKGFWDFINIAKDEQFSEYEFHCWGDDGEFELPKNVINHGKYSRNEIGDVFSSIDLLVIPSRWKETFGFLTVESIVHDIPVLATTNVGARDVLCSQLLCKKLDADSLSAFLNLESIATQYNIVSMSSHATEIGKLYERLV
jgi:glycosyltransferase involved in cell wall biosynthesis